MMQQTIKEQTRQYHNNTPKQTNQQNQNDQQDAKQRINTSNKPDITRAEGTRITR
jgi:hypothetical protein